MRKQVETKVDLVSLAIEAAHTGNDALLRLVEEARGGSLLAAKSLVVWGPWAARQRELRIMRERVAAMNAVREQLGKVAA